MKRIVLLASIVFATGAGCTASVQTRPAQPTYVSNEPPPPPPPRPGPGPGPVADRWVTLAESFAASTNRQMINISGRGEYRRIRVEATNGAPVIHQVAIEYMDDTNTQVVKIDSRLPPGAGQVIDLAGGRRSVRRIIVYSEPQFGGSYAVYGL